MSEPPLDEIERLRVLGSYDILDTAPEAELDELVALASSICGVPIALISLIDESRQWFKAKVGLEATETPRDVAFCAHVIAEDQPGVFTVPDAREDPRFRANPLVTGDPHVVFYAGAPLVGDGGAKLGTLCVIDDQPRVLTPTQERALETLSRVVVRHLELRRALAERKRLLAQTEAARRSVELQREHLLRAFVESPVAVGILRGDDDVVALVNPAMCRLWGRTQEELLGHPLAQVLPPGEERGIPVVAARVRRSGDPFIGRELPVLLPDGGAGPRFFNFVYQPLPADSGLLTEVLVVATDVTDQVVAARRFEEIARERKALLDARETAERERTALLEEARIARDVAERANRSMDEFLATVSHELRTPLNAMLGWTRLLRGERLPEAARPRALETIERNATAQAQLIEDLLDVSRIISGKMHVEALPLDFPAVLDAALDVVRPAAQAKGIRFELDLAPAASRVVGDAGRLQQVVWNLLSNAVKFTPAGGVITLELARSPGDAASGAGSPAIELRVTDSGVGLHEDMVDVIFERFRQVDGAITRTHGGLGLGLAIAKTIVELHGGSIRASSRGLGKGASFVVRLPASPEPTAQLAHPTPMDDATLSLTYPPHLRGLRVLVLDDEEDARDLLAMVLESCGIEVTTASSVAEALATLDRQVPALVLSDIGMPGEDGYGFARKLREREPERGGRIPAVAVTAYARAEDRTRALVAGFTSHVPKPIEPAELIAVIASLTAPA